MIIADTPPQIALFRLASLRGALKLEILGMTRRGQSVYSILKQEYGFKGNKASILKQLEEKIEELRND
mgnify:FL=1|jgi:hypothetical protein